MTTSLGTAIPGAPPSATSGALTVIAETVLAAPAASIDFTSIPATYRHLRLVLSGRCAGASSIVGLSARFNSDSTGKYTYVETRNNNGTVTGLSQYLGTEGLVGFMPDASAVASYDGGCDFTVLDYAGTTFFKQWKGMGGSFYAGAANSLQSVIQGQWHNAAAINQLTLFAASNFIAGTMATLYGLAHA